MTFTFAAVFGLIGLPKLALDSRRNAPLPLISCSLGVRAGDMVCPRR